MSSKWPQLSLPQLCLLRQIKSRASDISAYLSFRTLLPVLQKQRFLTDDEFGSLADQLENGRTDSMMANELLVILDRDCPETARKFIACLLEEKEHRGHRYIAERLMKKIPPSEAEKIHALITDKNPVPRTPVQLVEPQGSLRSRHFVALDREIWSRFNMGEYDKLSELTATIRRRPRYTNDHKIVAMWFDSLISMHRDGNHASSISNHLLPALELCRDSENRLILEGRIYQRMSQLYLVQGLKELADCSIAQAECCLQLVSRGYEQVNMLCRRAKLLSATADADKRNVVEELYIRALAAINEDDPFIMASRPSIILSTAAFYLHMSFGSKPNATDPPPCILEADIVKAKAVLARLPHIEVVLEMRKCELKVLKAELLRLEGDNQEALELFRKAVSDAQTSKLCNLEAIAKHRMRTVQMLSS